MELEHLIKSGSHIDVVPEVSERMGDHTAHHSDPDLNTQSPSGSFHEQKERHEVHTVNLRYSWYIVVLVLMYAALAIFSWTVIVILTMHPLTTKQYDYDSDTGYFNPAYGHSLYQSNEEWFQAARVINSVLAVLTIPLTSAVCSKAAVSYMQLASARHLSLRQTLTLADRGWSDPASYIRLMSGGFKKWGTKFLLGAIVLNILGGIISPLQSVLLTTKTIKTPTVQTDLYTIHDFLDKSGTWAVEADPLVVQARSAITATTVSSPQSRLWTGNDPDCAQSVESTRPQLPTSCLQGGAITLANMSKLQDPFYAQLPPGYNTGLIRQYLPRINSTAQHEKIDASQWPLDCASQPNAFWVRYGSINNGSRVTTGWGTWSLEVCMPGNQTRSPWRFVRQRQDFSEELYMNISLTAISAMAPLSTPEQQGGLFRITLNTTAGYFELPNYMNGQQPGDLLEGDPVIACSDECWRQGYIPLNSTVRRDANDYIQTTNSSLALERSMNPGPLRTIALALFGTGSFIAERLLHPEGFIYPYSMYRGDANANVCVGQAPLLGLLRDEMDQSQVGNPLDPCLRNTVYSHDAVQAEVVAFVHALYWNFFDGYKGERIANAFTAAAFLVNELWLTSGSVTTSWHVAFDLGADSIIPVISLAGKIIISSLLAVFLLALLGLAVFSAYSPRWTGQLDAFAILRLGASLADEIPFRVAHKVGDIQALDRLPGWIGDVTNGQGPYGELKLGAGTALKDRRTYIAYPTRDTVDRGRFQANGRVRDEQD